MSIISDKLKNIKPSPTLAVAAKAAELKSKGVDIISLSTGEPDFDTPDNIKNAAKIAIDNGQTKYTPVGGTKELKNAIINKFKRENNLDYQENEIIVSTGGKQVIYNLFMASLNEGDEVIIPSPYWVSYPDIVKMAGGKPVMIDSDIEQNFKINANQLKDHITDKTKWIILNSPSNPTGAVYLEEELKETAKLLLSYPDVHVMLDDIYEHIIFDDIKFANLLMVEPKLKDRVFIVNGVSKGYSMTGWRIGYGAGDAKLIKAMSIIQSQSTSNPSSISQAAAIEALNGDQSFILDNKNEFQKKRDLVLGKFSNMKLIDCGKSNGAFYLFPSIKNLIGMKTIDGKIINNSTDFATYLLESANVAIVPGIAFGAENYFRLSYATSFEILEEATDRIAKALNLLK